MSFRLANVAHKAEINEGDMVVRQHKEIACVGIGLIETEFKDLSEKGAKKALGGSLQVHIRREQTIHFIEGDAVDIFHDHDVCMSEVPVNLWHEEIEIIRKDLREAGHVGRLHDEIELLVDGVGEFLHHLHRVQEPAFGQVFFHQGGERAQHRNVRGNQLIDPLTLDLDYDLVART